MTTTFTTTFVETSRWTRKIEATSQEEADDLAYDDFILDIATSHPQMMELLGHVLGEGFLIDHVIMLNRTPGSKGRRWHGHPYRQGQYETEDPVVGGAPTVEFLEHQCVRTLCLKEFEHVKDSKG